ncbi:MAG: nucleotidyltransferase family protein, partial [Clostridiales bacterium]|nr:nucleotidyltransferase family protein [Clostridiales bacterium]
MKTIGIIAEYNPFHKGHAYQIAYAKKALGADRIVVAMSGDYVQRGAPALLSKQQRTRMAL